MSKLIINNFNSYNAQEKVRENKNKMETIKIMIPIIVALIGAVATIGAALITALTSSNYGDNALDSSYAVDINQNFSCNKVEMETYFNLEFICYELNSLPDLSSYKVMPFPYIEISKGGNSIYIPLISQFTQEEYVADSNGICILRRENTTEYVIELLKNELEYNVNSGCYLAIEYISQNGDRHIGFYKLSNGQLLNANEEEVARVIYNTKDDNSFKINMLDWNKYKNDINLFDVVSKLK